MGCSKNGSKTGLHCDYHDNLYCLLKGRKKFSLFSPDQSYYLYPNGNILKIHHNGLIIFKGKQYFKQYFR
jgi:hypothetical protein